MKLYTTCASCKDIMLVVSHPLDTHPTCADPLGFLDELRRMFLEACLVGDDRLATNLAETLDVADQAPQNLPGAAEWYARRGWPVFPLRPGGKTPGAGAPRGFHQATTDVRQVRAWWNAVPEGNIGSPTGRTFDVIDIDYRTYPGAMRAWSAIKDEFVAHGVVSTPRGIHYYVKPSDVPSGAGALGVSGLDYRGTGGYVVLPPSRRPDGRYFWWSPPSPEL